METKVYVDVLLVLNYIINMLLVLCTARLTGRRPTRRRIVAAALFGSVSALTIFLPFFGFVLSILTKLLFSAAMVLIGFSYLNFRTFAKQLFVFFATSFFFAGVMLAVWMAFAPRGMIYYNGIVYFDLSSLTLLATTAVAYAALTLAHRFMRGGRLHTAVYDVRVLLDGREVALRGLVDTGNSLYEPFSDTPVMVCCVDDIAPLLPPEFVEQVKKGGFADAAAGAGPFPVRLIPYKNIGGRGMIPAIRSDRLLLSGESGEYRVENVYIGMTPEPVGAEGYNAILNPDLIGIRLLHAHR